MNTRCRRCLRRSKRGLTLVEAALGAAILGTLLVALLAGASRMQGQSVRADRRINACRTADGLLEGWWEKPDAFPRSSSGTTEAGWSWRTHVIENPQAAAMKGEVVAVEVFAPGQGGESSSPAARVEVMLPERPRENGTDAR